MADEIIEKKENRIVRGGLLKTPKDKRDFQLGKIIKWPKLEELPDSFQLEPVSIKDQGDTDFCSAFATCGMSELQEGVELNPYWSFAVSKMISKDPDTYGQDLRSAMKVHAKYGAIEGDNSFNLSAQEIRYIENYPGDYRTIGLNHQKQSFFKVAGWPKEYDAFDAVRAAIWLFRDLKRAVAFGVLWSWPLDEIYLKDYSPDGNGHATYLRGWQTWKKYDKGDATEIVMVLQNSYGREVGNLGYHLISRKVVNDMVRQFGAFMFVDMPPQIAKQKVWSLWQRFCGAVKDYFNIIFE